MILAAYLIIVFVFGAALYEFSLWRRRNKYDNRLNHGEDLHSRDNDEANLPFRVEDKIEKPVRLSLFLYVVWSFAVGIGVSTLIMLVLLGACNMGMIKP